VPTEHSHDGVHVPAADLGLPVRDVAPLGRIPDQNVRQRWLVADLGLSGTVVECVQRRVIAIRKKIQLPSALPIISE